jgi:hypothetical protein
MHLAIISFRFQILFCADLKMFQESPVKRKLAVQDITALKKRKSKQGL